MLSNNRALAAIVLVNFVSLAGFGFMFPVFAVYGQQIGASGSEIAWAIAAFSLGQFISGPLWGKLSDVQGRRKVLILSLIAGTVIYAANIFATTPLVLIAMRFLAGLASGSFAISFAVASDISTPQNRTKVMGLVSAGFSLGFIFGPALGGLVAGLAPEGDGFLWVCLAGSALMGLAGLATFILLPETLDPDAAAEEEPVSTLQLLSNPALAIPIFVGFVAMTAVAMMEAVFILFADVVLGLTPFGIGLMFSAMGVIGAISQATAAGPAARKFGERGMLLASMLVLAGGMFLMAGSTTVAMGLLSVGVLAVGFSLINPALSGLVSFAAPAAAQGAALGLMQASSSLGRVVGPAAAGPIYDIQGPTAPFYWSGAILIVTFVGALFLLPKGGVVAEEKPEAAAKRYDAAG